MNGHVSVIGQSCQVACARTARGLYILAAMDDCTDARELHLAENFILLVCEPQLLYSQVFDH